MRVIGIYRVELLRKERANAWLLYSETYKSGKCGKMVSVGGQANNGVGWW